MCLETVSPIENIFDSLRLYLTRRSQAVSHQPAAYPQIVEDSKVSLSSDFLNSLHSWDLDCFLHNLHLWNLHDKVIEVTLVDVHTICNVFRNIRVLLVDVDPRLAGLVIQFFAVNVVRTLGSICLWLLQCVLMDVDTLWIVQYLLMCPAILHDPSPCSLTRPVSVSY